jgi:hypothetical protein
MTTQQRLATAFLALLIVGSVSLMPKEADSRPRNVVPAINVHAAPSPATEASEPVRDLTYN